MFKQIFKKIFSILISWGFNPILFFNSIRGFFLFVGNSFSFLNQFRSEKDFKKLSFFPIFSDKFELGGNMESIYFQQDLFIAQKIFLNEPVSHLDIGSRMDGFVANVATFRKIDVVDIRPASSKVANIVFKQLDMTILPVDMENTYDSVSCLHAIEHFGLGRYGDTIDLNGHVKGFDNIYKILSKNGRFYFSTPIGSLRIEFNAHRVFSLAYLITILFKDKFIIESFSYIDDCKLMHINVDLDKDNIQSNFGCIYGCGIFELQKI